MLICINRILISAWVFSLLLSPSEAQHCLDLAGEACALLGSSESCGPANLMGRGPLAGCHGVVYVRLLSAAFFLLVFFFPPSFSFSPVSAATHLYLSLDSSCPWCKRDKRAPGW